MSLRADTENDPIALNSDIEQSLDEAKRKLNLAIEALKDISVWAKDLDEAKGIANFILHRLEN